jgi:hypothetical protein
VIGARNDRQELGSIWVVVGEESNWGKAAPLSENSSRRG